MSNQVEEKIDKLLSRFYNFEKRVKSIKGIVGENMPDIADINRRLGKAN